MKKIDNKHKGTRTIKKNQRREEAIERNEKWQALSFQDQWNSLNDRGMVAEKQRTRINAAIEKNK